MMRALWYYWLAARAVLVVVWGYMWRGDAFRRGVRSALAGSTFTRLAVRRGVARPDIAVALFGTFGELDPADAIAEARAVRVEAAAAGFSSDNMATFRRRMHAQNVLRCAVDLGLLAPADLAGLVAK